MNAPATFARQMRVPITADMFDAMYRAGALAGRPRVELRDGDLVEMSPKYEPHAVLTFDLATRLDASLRAIGSPMRVVPEVSVRLNEHRVAEPDIVVWLAPRSDGFIPADVVKIAVEVAATTLAEDIGPRRLEYAAAGIPEYWVVDVRNRIVWQYSQCEDGDYRLVRSSLLGEPLVSSTIDGLVIDTAGL